MAVLRIKQGVVTAPAGEMLAGVAGTLVELSNSDDTGIEFWQYELLEVPFSGSVPVGILASGSNPTASFLPDAVPGTYQIKLTTRSTAKVVTSDVNSFAVPTPVHAWIIPAFRSVPKELQLNGNQKSYAAFIAKFMQDADGFGGFTGTLTADKGGTGITEYAVGDLLYASGATTLSKLPKGTVGQTLVQGASAPEWATISTTPTAHATSHKHGGSDEIATTTAAANAIPKAGAGGTLAVNWLPTGTSSATVCIGNDVRVPASNPTALTAGQSVVSNGSRVVYRGDVGRWWNSGITPGSTANDAHNLAVNNAPPSLRNGHPIRILDADGLVCNATTTAPKLVSSDQAITGLRGELFDHRGCLWFRVVVVSGTQCRINIYNDEWCAAGNLVGHTGQFDTTSSTTVTLTVTADNGSGLGGTFKIDTRSSTATAATHSIQYFKTGIVQSVDNDNGELSFNGQAVSTATGSIKELWFGAPELVVAMHGQIVGPYAPETTNTALLNRNADSVRWQHGPATIVQCYAMHLVNDTGATQPKLIPMIDGTAVMVDGSAATMTASPILTDLIAGATSTNLRVVAGSGIEFRTVQGTNGNARNAIFDLLAVLD